MLDGSTVMTHLRKSLWSPSGCNNDYNGWM